jgi:hypothetical protein
MSAAIFGSFIMYEYGNYGFIPAALWIVLISMSTLIIGINSLNQIIFGTFLGFWLSIFIFYIIDF